MAIDPTAELAVELVVELVVELATELVVGLVANLTVKKMPLGLLEVLPIVLTEQMIEQ